MFKTMMFGQRLQDDKFALVMNIFLSNDDFSKGDGAPVWSSSEKQAAYLVAGLRELGECYQDFYLVDGIGVDERLYQQNLNLSGETKRLIFKEIDDHLARLGWRRESSADLYDLWLS